MSRTLRSTRGIEQDYNRFLECVSSSISLLNMPYISSGNDKYTLTTAEPIRFIAENVALKHARPNELERIEVSIIFLLKYGSANFQCYYDDMISSNMNIQFRAINKEEEGNNHFGFHFDFDGRGESESSKQEQLHPKYHTQFLQNPSDMEGFKYGNSLQLDIPRFTHFPMDFILGTSFVIANFAPKLFEELRENDDFIRLQKKYQDLLWKPYLIALNNLLKNSDSNDFKSAQHLHPYWLS